MLRRVLILLALACSFLATANAADPTLQEQLNVQYQDKVLALRHPYHSRSQEYAADGAPLNAGEEGPWTLYGRIRVQKVSVDHDRLTLEGRRILYSFDKNGKLTEYPDDRKPPFENIKIAVRLPKPLSSANEAATILGNIFTMTAEDIVNSAPVYWQAYLAQQLGAQVQREQAPQSANSQAKKENRDCAPGQRGMTAPRAVYQPEPQFSEAARARRFQGMVAMNVIVDTTGKATDMKIDQPLGMGLDEQAIADVSAWKFAPATRNGCPVAVTVRVQVDFHLY